MGLPERLRLLWGEVDAGRRAVEEATAEQERQLEAYRAEWSRALLTQGEHELRTGLLREVAAYYKITDLAEVEQLCSGAVDAMRQEWGKRIDPSRRASIESFY